MRTRILLGSLVALALILGAPVAFAGSPDVLGASEEATTDETNVVEPSLDLFEPEPESRVLEPCTAADGSTGTYFCTGSTCTNGQQCAHCCSSSGVNCGSLTCVDNCIWPR